MSQAQRTLDVAIYDLHLQSPLAETLLAAFDAARARGVAVRVLFNVDHPRQHPDPPPCQVDWELVKRLGPFRPVSGVPDLMHHKYCVRDGTAVWTGSTNWTDDSWTREENVILEVASPELAARYEADFEELWTTENVAASGKETPDWVQLQGGPRLRAYFTPGRARQLVHEIAGRIGHAQRRLRICSPVITSGPILGTLAEVVENQRLDIKGCYDGTQMAEVLRQWAATGQPSWKTAAFEAVIAKVPLGAKASTPWQEGSVHDFMHAKCLVADDTVFAGSYNLSHSGELNAENVIEIEDAALADSFSAYIEALAARYPPAPRLHSET